MDLESRWNYLEGTEFSRCCVTDAPLFVICKESVADDKLNIEHGKLKFIYLSVGKGCRPRRMFRMECIDGELPPTFSIFNLVRLGRN